MNSTINWLLDSSAAFLSWTSARSCRSPGMTPRSSSRFWPQSPQSCQTQRSRRWPWGTSCGTPSQETPRVRIALCLLSVWRVAWTEIVQAKKFGIRVGVHRGGWGTWHRRRLPHFRFEWRCSLSSHPCRWSCWWSLNISCRPGSNRFRSWPLWSPFCQT